jgi:hypothetical protein
MVEPMPQGIKAEAPLDNTEVDKLTSVEGVSPPSPQTDAAVISRLAAMLPIDFDRVRRDEAKALGIQTKTLDDLVKEARSSDADSRLPFKEHEPADDPVEPAALFEDITKVIQTYIVLDQEQADAAAVWIAHTYLTDVFDVSPIAIINAPERACAKTLFQSLIGMLAYRPLPASNASLSALFRAIEHWQPTILIDEADTFFRDNAELHGMVNAGYKRGGFVLRSESTGESFEPRMFSVYGPKSIAGIALEKHLPDSTMSRGVVFGMRRKLPHEKVERMRGADKATFVRLGSQLARFALDYAHQARMASPHLPPELGDRAQDNWEPLLAIAACAGKEWIERITAAAIKMSADGEPAASNTNELLSDIRDVLAKWNGQTIPTVDLIGKLCDDEDMGWATYNRGRPLTARQLARQLDVYGIKPKTVRQSKTKTPKGYEVVQFDDAFTRYLKAATGTTPLNATEQSLAVPAPDVAATPQLTNLDTFDVDFEAARFGVADTGEGDVTPPADDTY